jgi:hypothetical protein
MWVVPGCGVHLRAELALGPGTAVRPGPPVVHSFACDRNVLGGFSSAVLMRLKIAVSAPIPKARIKTAVMVNPGAFKSTRIV